MPSEAQEQQVEYWLSELPKHYDDPNWLSKCAIHLSTLLYGVGDLMAAARVRENQVAIGYLDEIPAEGGKKMSVSESEKRAIVETNDEYEKQEKHYQSVVETINSIKKRIDSLGQLAKAGI